MPTGPLATSRQRLRLTLLCIAQFVLILDVVVVNVALPSMRADLHIPDARLAIVGVAYTLTFGALLIVFGRAGDLYGRRRLFVTGLSLFGVASAMAGSATNEWLLFAARAVQGVGAAMVSSTALALLLTTFPEGGARNRALGVWGAVGSAGAIAGQVIGGTLVSSYGWRSIFLINIPIVIVVVALGRLVIAADAHRSAGRIDVPGAVLLAGTFAALTVSLVRVAEHGLDTSVALWLTIAVLAGVALWRVERRHPEPVIDRRLLASRPVRTGNTILAINAGVMTAALFFVTLYLQLVLGMSPMAVGLAFAPVTVLVLAISPVAGRVVTRVGVRPPLIVGTISGTAGLLWLARVPADGTYIADVLPGLVLLAIMGGASYAPTFVAGTSGIPDDRHGVASGLLSTAQELGAAFGLATLSAVAIATASGPSTTATYRAGFIAAALACAAALLVAARAPSRLGTAEESTAPAPALATVGGDR